MEESTLDVQTDHEIVWFQDVGEAFQGFVACRSLDGGGV